MFSLEPCSVEEASDFLRAMHAEHDRNEIEYWGRPAAPATDDPAHWARFDHIRVLRKGELVGRLALADRTVDEMTVLEVGALWVEPEARGQGVARHLIRVAESEVRRRGRRLLMLDVAASNLAGRRAYAATGLNVVSQMFRIDPAATPPVSPYEVRREPRADGMIELSSSRRRSRPASVVMAHAPERGVVVLVPTSGEARHFPPLAAAAAAIVQTEGWSELLVVGTGEYGRAMAKFWPPYYFTLAKEV